MLPEGSHRWGEPKKTNLVCNSSPPVEFDLYVMKMTNKFLMIVAAASLAAGGQTFAEKATVTEKAKNRGAKNGADARRPRKWSKRWTKTATKR